MSYRIQKDFSRILTLILSRETKLHNTSLFPLFCMYTKLTMLCNAANSFFTDIHTTIFVMLNYPYKSPQSNSPLVLSLPNTSHKVSVRSRSIHTMLSEFTMNLFQTKQVRTEGVRKVFEPLWTISHLLLNASLKSLKLIQHASLL